MDDPAEFWKDIGRLTGWRLGACQGMDQAAFYTSHGTEVLINAHVAAVIRMFSETLSETVESFNTLIESVVDIPELRAGVTRAKGIKEAVLLAKSYGRLLDCLEREHGYLFAGVDGVDVIEDEES